MQSALPAEALNLPTAHAAQLLLSVLPLYPALQVPLLDPLQFEALAGQAVQAIWPVFAA
jgi:hypothetical protein